MKIRLLGRARKRISSNPGCANHSDEPLKAKIMSAEASIIFEFHLHCTISELNTIFLIPVADVTVSIGHFFTRLD